MVWALREYDENEPIMLSVPESGEISIKEVAETIVKGLDYKGQLKVCDNFQFLPSSTPPRQTDSTRKLPATKS